MKCEPVFPFEILASATTDEDASAQELLDDYVAAGGTPETLLLQLNRMMVGDWDNEKSMGWIVHGEEYLPILEFIEDYRNCAMPLVADAIDWSNWKAVDLLISRGARLDLASARAGLPLCAAVWGEEVGVVRLVDQLLEAGADPDSCGTDGETALMSASRYGAHHVVRRLIEAGADVHRRDNRGYTALHYAAAPSMTTEDDAQADVVEVVELLLKAGANPNARDFARDTPLHVMACIRDGISREESARVLDLLVRYGADLESIGESSKTPILVAASNVSRGDIMVDLLYRAGANIHAKVFGSDGVLQMAENVLAEGAKRVVNSIFMEENVNAALGLDRGEVSTPSTSGFSPM
jgi:hypothetical protein